MPPSLSDQPPDSGRHNRSSSAASQSTSSTVPEGKSSSSRIATCSPLFHSQRIPSRYSRLPPHAHSPLPCDSERPPHVILSVEQLSWMSRRHHPRPVVPEHGIEDGQELAQAGRQGQFGRLTGSDEAG